MKYFIIEQIIRGRDIKKYYLTVTTEDNQFRKLRSVLLICINQKPPEQFAQAE